MMNNMNMNNQMNPMGGMMQNNMNGMMNMMNFNNQNIPMNQMVQMMGNMNAQMANNFANQGNPQNNNDQSQNNNGGINIRFRRNGVGDNREIVIQCLPDEKVSDVIQRYRTKSGDNDTTKKFIFNAKALNQSLSVAEAGLANNVNVFVVTTKDIKGAR